MNMKWYCDIPDDLRQALISEQATQEQLDAAENGDYRAVAVLELGNLDVELNLCAAYPSEHNSKAYPGYLSPDFFFCIKYGDDRNDWDSLGYAEDYIDMEDSGAYFVAWDKPTWEDQLFVEMLYALRLLYLAHPLSFVHPNSNFFGARGG